MSDQLQRWIESAGCGLTFEEIMAGVERGDFLLWRHPEGVMVSEFIISPRTKVMHVFIAAGSMTAIDELRPVVEAFGRAMGCDTGGATGRKGWLRYLKQHGYRAADLAVQKEL